MKQELKDRITKVAESLDFSVYFSERYNEENSFDIEFSGYTDLGQNIVFSEIMKDDDPHSLVKSLYDGWQAYDPDEEASYWIGPDGHGKNGAPYRISDIVKDMEEAESQYEKLYEEMRKEFKDYPEDETDEEDE